MYVETVTAIAPVRVSAGNFVEPSVAAVAAPEGVAAHPSLAACLKLHRQLEAVTPEWFDYLAQHDLLLCDDRDLDALLGSAPGDFMVGYVFSWFSSRSAIAMLTQRYEPSGFQGPARRAAIAQLARESEAHDGWFTRMDLVDAETCPKDDLLDLLDSAPSPFMRGYLYGKITMRVEMAAMTGRPF